MFHTETRKSNYGVLMFVHNIENFLSFITISIVIIDSTIYIHNNYFCNSKAKNDSGVIYALSATTITAHNSFFDSNMNQNMQHMLLIRTI